MGPALRLHGVTKRYAGKLVLDALDLEVPAGQIVAVLGPSGTGKTTLLRILGGGLRPDAGIVEVFGVDLVHSSGAARRRLRRRIGLLYQNDALVPGLRVLHNVLIGRLGHWKLMRSLRSLLFPADRGSAEAALAEVGLADRSEEPLSNLSGGQRQRVALARLLVQQAELVLADEPATHLDPQLAQQVVTLLIDLCRRHGSTALVSLQDLALLSDRFDRVLALRDGNLRFDGPPAGFDQPRRQDLYAGR